MKKIFFLFIALITFFSFFSIGHAADADGDGVENSKDICSLTPNGVSVDTSGITAGCSDVQKTIDSDGDGYVDINDAFKNDATEWRDTDLDTK